MVDRRLSTVDFIVALILHIETATTVCSAALSENGKLLSLKEENKGLKHAEHITLFIMHVLEEAKKKLADLDAIAVSSGPGSYTGLRIGASTAKGLCYALEKPLISVSTLLSLSYQAISQISDLKSQISNPYFCPMIDARRMEVFCAVYDEALKEVEKIAPKIIDENSFADLLKSHKIYFFGDGSEKCKNILSHQHNAVFMDDIVPSAAAMISFAEEKFSKKDFEDVSLFEPFYSKEFVDGKTITNSQTHS